MGPDFLCIGAPKTGTTWLYRQLKRHPAVWMPVVKELHYFDRRFPIPRVAEKVGVKRGIFGFYPEHARASMLKAFARAIGSGSPGNVPWVFRYYNGRPDDDWYLSLFPRDSGRLCGEITTDYCALSREGASHVLELLPHVRLVFLMRNPVDRAWSHARMLLPELLGKPLDQIGEQEFLSYLAHPAARRKSEYTQILERWESVFPPEQMFLGFYDDIVRNPRTLLADVLEFLGLDEGGCLAANDLKTRVNPGRGGSKCPPAIRRCLAEQFMPELESLSARFGGYPQAWYERERAVLADGPQGAGR